MNLRNLAVGGISAVTYLAMACSSDPPPTSQQATPTSHATPSQQATPTSHATPSQQATPTSHAIPSQQTQTPQPQTPASRSLIERISDSVIGGEYVNCTPHCVIEEDEVGKNAGQYVVFEPEWGKHLKFTIVDRYPGDNVQYEASLGPGDSYLAPNGAAIGLVEYFTPRSTPGAPIPRLQAEIYMLEPNACRLTEEIPVGEKREFELDGHYHSIKPLSSTQSAAAFQIDEKVTPLTETGSIFYGNDIAFKLCDVSHNSVVISKPQ